MLGAWVGALCTPASGGPSLPLSLSFPIMDGSCTLGEGGGAEGIGKTEAAQIGKTEAAAQVIPCPPHPHPKPNMPAAHPGPVAWADVSSLGKSLTRPGRRPTPVGAIRRRADGTNSCWPAGPSTGVATLRGMSPSLQDLRAIPAGCHRAGG